MPHEQLQHAHMDLLLQLDRLLAEADRARVLRDHLFAMAHQGTQLPAPPVVARRRGHAQAVPADAVEAAHA